MNPSYTTQNRRMREALRDIASYPLPVRTVLGEHVVSLDDAMNLRKLAHDALLTEVDSGEVLRNWSEAKLHVLERCLDRLDETGFNAATLDLDGQELVVSALRSFLLLITATRRTSNAHSAQSDRRRNVPIGPGTGKDALDDQHSARPNPIRPDR